MKKNLLTAALLLLALLMPLCAFAQDAQSAAACSHTGGLTPGGESGHVCTDCGELLPHSLTTIVTQPTCRSVGYTMDVCPLCGWQSAQYDIKNIDSSAHVWGEWTVSLQPDCSVEGERTRSCTICAATETEAIPTTAHDLYDVVHAPSCVEDGYTVAVCRDCGFTGEKTDIVPRSAAYHKWGAFVVSEQPSCEEPGSQVRECSVCGAKHRQEIEPTGHSAAIVKVPAGCEDGYTVAKCTVCGKETSPRTDIIPGSHRWGEWKTVVLPDCVNNGLKERVCSVCKKAESEVVPAMGHDLKEGYRKPTCVLDGYTAVVCAECGWQQGEIYDVIPAGEEYHVWDEDRWDREKEPTCTEWGVYYQGCLYCDTMRKVPIMPKGHRGEEHTFEADFAHDGYTVGICTVCGRESCPRYDIVPAGMFSVPMQEMQIDSIEAAGVESAVLCTAVSDEGEQAALLEIRADASGVVEIDFEREWFAKNHVVRVIVYCGEVRIEAEAEGTLRIETAVAEESEGRILTVLSSLPNDGFGEEKGEYRHGVYSASLSEEEPTELLGRCIRITAPKGRGTLLVLSSAQEG